MGWLRDLLNPRREEVWRRLSEEIGADFVEGGLWRASKVQARVKEWTLTLDTYTLSTGKVAVTCTRLRAPFVNRDGFRFLIYRKSPFSGLGKALGMQDIEVGHALGFDEDFIIKGNDEHKVRRLFANPEIRRLIEEQPEIRLELKDDEDALRGRYPEGVDELRFTALGVIDDLERLKKLYELFAEVLDELCRMGSASPDDPGVDL